jgi:small-conductance mechanosensitive channel
MLTFTLAVSLGLGIILCFMGYRFFRVAMALGGFAIGAAIGYFIYPFVADKLPAAGQGVWLMVLMGLGGILLAFLSFSIYKAALFYITALFTAFIILKTFLLGFGGIGVSAFIKTILGKTAIVGSTDFITDYEVADKGTVGELINKALDMLPGKTDMEKLGVVLIASLIVGAVVGIIVCILQKPAIIVVTAVMGAFLAAQGLVSIIESFDQLDLSAETVIANFSVGGESVVLSSLLTVLLIIIGIVVQFKTTKKMD